MSRVSVVILNYNGQQLLRKFLPSVISFSNDASIIVADNSSTDLSISILREEFPSVRLIEISSNLGFCGGYNLALRQVDTPYYVLLNSDVEVTAGWLDPIIRLLDADPLIAAVQPKILSYNDKEAFEYAGAAGGFIDLLGYPFCRGRIFETVEKNLGQYDDERRVFWATGASLAIRSEAFHSLGGFDNDFFAHMEEIDLCWRLNRAGLKIYYTGKSTVYHVGGGTLSRTSATKTYLNFRNGLFLIVKNTSIASMLWKLPVRMMLDWAALVRFLVQGSWPHAWAVLKAHLHFAAGLGRCFNSRRSFRSIGFNLRSGAVYGRPIALTYYLSGYKTYSQLDTRDFY